ncbi:hypothetical protein AAKU58_004123 [Oxalobacteraceae bacterium GrIS 1.18]
MTDHSNESPQRGRPKKPGGALTAVQRQAAYRKKKLDEGIEISLFLTHAQAAILRKEAKRANQSQSEFVGTILEKEPLKHQISK